MLRQIRDYAGELFVSLGETVVGVLLLVDPVRFTSGILVAFGALVSLLGVYYAVRYFLSEPRQASRECTLSKGLLLLCAGLFCMLGRGAIISTFPALTVIFGAGLLLISLFKVQKAVDMLRMKRDKWFLAAISAATALAAAVLVFVNPFESALLLWIIIGVTLIAEAVLDLLSIFMRMRRKEQTSGEKTE